MAIKTKQEWSFPCSWELLCPPKIQSTEFGILVVLSVSMTKTRWRQVKFKKIYLMFGVQNEECRKGKYNFLFLVIPSILGLGKPNIAIYRSLRLLDFPRKCIQWSVTKNGLAERFHNCYQNALKFQRETAHSRVKVKWGRCLMIFNLNLFLSYHMESALILGLLYGVP